MIQLRASRVKYKAYDDYQYIVFHSINSDDYSPRALNVFLKIMY